MSLSPGSRLGPYEILSLLGAGGMGEVWRANDRRLARDVAIKVLPEEFFEGEERRQRFEREAKLLASLNHPNIAAIFSFEEASGPSSSSPRHLLVMELVDGESLSKRMKAGTVPLPEVLAIGRDIAAALEAAHAKGIVHRDLKPGNVMLSKEGRVKLLDFGLAKSFGDPVASAELSHSPTLTDAGTSTGVILGTAAYMSPEQARGQRVDARTDVWAFGVVLWELLTGKRLFRGESTPDTLAAVLREPVDFRQLPLTTPRGVRTLLARCLEREPEKRLTDIADARRALEKADAGAAQIHVPARTLAGAAIVLILFATGTIFLARRWRGASSARGNQTTSAVKPVRIVVLPFENLGAAQDAYLAAGMTEEISSRLANLAGLAVISRTTAIGYDRKGKTIKQIGADLGVDYVLEGTVLSDRNAAGGGRMRIAPELIQASDDTHVWADRYDRVLADIFTIQSEVAENVVRVMGVKLIPREEAALKTASTNDIEAYKLYLRGLEITRRGETLENLSGGFQMYQAAVDRDPRFPQALLHLARNHLYIYFTYMDRSPEHLVKAKDAVDRLAAIGADLAETHMARGDYAYWGRGDYPGALEEFKRALVLQPSSTDTLELTGYVMRRQGRWEEAADQLSNWVKIDPQNPLALFQYGLTCNYLRRYSEADRTLSLATSLSPQFGTPWQLRVLLEISWHGDIEKADAVLAAARRVVGLQDGTGEVGIRSFQIALMKRDFRGALRQLDEEKREAFSNQNSFFPIELFRGQAHALLGEPDLATRSFEAARRRLVELTSKDPGDARYQSSLGIACAGLGLREEALRAANKGVELLPPSKDALRALFRIEQLALVQSMLGLHDEAIDSLDFLLSRAGLMSAKVLRLDPRWEPLKASPRFEALLAKYDNKS